MLAVGLVIAAWLFATARQRQRRRENRNFDRAAARSTEPDDEDGS